MYLVALALTLAVTSCDATVDEAREAPERTGSVAQALTDTDSDGMDDDWEIQHFGDLSQTSAGDFDADGMTNGEEHLHGFVPTTNDAFEDADGDRYPNVFEIRNSSDPNDAGSKPTPTFVVNGAGGGTHTTVSAAVAAANVQNGAYQILGIAPGVYTGAANLSGVTLAAAKPKFLVIGLEGAAKTILDGGGTTSGWIVYNAAVISSLTFQKTTRALYVSAPSREVRVVDLMARDNASPGSQAPGVHVDTLAQLHVVGSTFLNNTGVSTTHQLYVGSGAATLVNTVVSGQGSGPMVGKGVSATLTTNHCLVVGQTLTGTGNLAGSTDPKLRSDGRLRWDSPLRGAGGSVAQSRVDMDGEPRPSSAPDIGADQFVDSDADELADHWELEHAGDLTTLTSRAQDADGDGLSNEDEYVQDTHPTVADTDGDGLSDGDEVNIHGTNPLSTDTDGDDMPDAWEVSHGLAPLVANAFEDADGDRYPNVFEYAGSTDPADPDSKPAPTFVVNGTGGGTHTTVSAAIAAANVQNGAYQILGIAPGVYTGSANLSSVSFPSGKPKFLVIGLEGAAKTVIEGDGTTSGWGVYNAAVIASLTFRKTSRALLVSTASQDVRLVDLLVRDNAIPSSYPSGVQVQSVARLHVVGSTFLNNTGYATAHQIYVASGAATLVNTVVWGEVSGPMVAKAPSATLTTNHCLVKGQTLPGTGNLGGAVDPKLRSDGRLLWDSPLRAAGGSVVQSRVDIDGESRPSSSPDIGADQFVDSDADGLADIWELHHAGDLTTLTSRTQDADGDGLSNDEEYATAGTDPTVSDTDGDGLSDGDEVNVHGTDPLKTDTDGDDMPDAWEVAHGLAPLVADALDDADGDRYPNVFEYVYSTNPVDAQSMPTPTFVVDGAGGGTHASVSAAVNAANVQNGAYQIIGVAPGIYTGSENFSNVILAATKPKFLIIGLEGAAKTIFDGYGTDSGWVLYNTAVIASLTFRHATQALYVSASSSEVRLTDLLMRDNAGPSSPSGIYVNAVGHLHIVGSTFLNNRGNSQRADHIYVASGAVTMVNSVVWGQTAGPMLRIVSGVSLTTNHCLVAGQTLAGTGNLDGALDPGLRSDGRLRTDSPLRGAGGSVVQSRVDMDGELRPMSAPDIGVDQFNDADEDGLPDGWEVASFGNTTSISGADDEDDDGLSNAEEYDLETDLFNPDTDGDGLIDGLEIAHGLNPHVVDSDDLGTDLNGDGIIDSIGIQLGYSSHYQDSDGDGVSNEEESLMCTVAFRADTDGDGVPDDVDAFPHDPWMSVLPTDVEDVTAPVITLTAPWYAVEQ